MKRVLAITGFLFVLFICAFIGASAALCKTLVIADIAPMSGPAAAWGIAGDRGLRMMVDEINDRGGIRVGKETYKIQVVTMDHRYVPGEALGAGKKAVREGIKFSFGVGGGVMPALQPVLEENKVIYIASMGGGVEFTNAKCPHTFRSGRTGDIAYNLFLPRFVKMWGPMKMGFVLTNDENGRADLRISKRVIGEQKLPIEQVAEFVERDAIDFSPIVTRLMAKGVDLIFNELPPAQGATFCKQTWEFGYKGRVGIIRATSLEPILKAAGKEVLEGLISGSSWPSDKFPSARYEKVLSKFLSLYKEEPNMTAYDHYAGMEFLAAALEKAGTLDTDRVAKVMYDLEMDTVYGPTCMVGKSLGYGIKTQMSYGLPFCEVRNGQLKLIDVLRYKE
jgi:branched-chain amino acid transport system substrate-binding protein